MSDILQKILATKRREVDESKAKVSLPEIEERARNMPPSRDFIGAIRAKHAAGKAAVIAEIKKASPSAGVFRSGLSAVHATFDPARFAASYEAHGAACLSVLTDRDYFQGSTDDLVAARAACRLPVLRKDFVVDPYQIFEARAMGADAVLFIMGAAPIAKFLEWEALATSLGLCVLAESHYEAELLQALALKHHIPAERIVITESGIYNAGIVAKMSAAGVGTYLIGGALMEAEEPGAALASLFEGTLV